MSTKERTCTPLQRTSDGFEAGTVHFAVRIRGRLDEHERDGLIRLGQVLLEGDQANGACKALAGPGVQASTYLQADCCTNPASPLSRDTRFDRQQFCNDRIRIRTKNARTLVERLPTKRRRKRFQTDRRLRDRRPVRPARLQCDSLNMDKSKQGSKPSLYELWCVCAHSSSRMDGFDEMSC